MLDLIYNSVFSNDYVYDCHEFKIKQRTEFSKIELYYDDICIKFNSLDEMLFYCIDHYDQYTKDIYNNGFEWRDFCTNYLSDVFSNDYYKIIRSYCRGGV